MATREIGVVREHWKRIIRFISFEELQCTLSLVLSFPAGNPTYSLAETDGVTFERSRFATTLHREQDQFYFCFFHSSVPRQRNATNKKGDDNNNTN